MSNNSLLYSAAAETGSDGVASALGVDSAMSVLACTGVDSSAVDCAALGCAALLCTSLGWAAVVCNSLGCTEQTSVKLAAQ